MNGLIGPVEVDPAALRVEAGGRGKVVPVAVQADVVVARTGVQNAVEQGQVVRNIYVNPERDRVRSVPGGVESLSQPLDPFGVRVVHGRGVDAQVVELAVEHLRRRHGLVRADEEPCGAGGERYARLGGILDAIQVDP